MADFSYLPLGWTCQQLLNNATQNLGYDAHAPNLPGHPSVRPITGEADHMMAGGPGDSVGGPISNQQMRLHFDTTTDKGYSDGVLAINPAPELGIASSKKEQALLAGVDHGAYVGTNVSTPQTRDGRYDPPAPQPAHRATPEGEQQFADAQERAGDGPAVVEARALDEVSKPAENNAQPKADK